MTRKHLLLMLACCLIPIGLIIAIGALAIPVNGAVSVVIALMCPLMMLFMMFGMHGGHEEHHEHHTPITTEKRVDTYDQQSSE